MGFLSEAITSTYPRNLTPFTECIVLATIFGRSLSNRQFSSVENLYGDTLQSFVERHQCLDSILEQRLEYISANYPSGSDPSDPMALFINMVARTAILYQAKVMRLALSHKSEYIPFIREFNDRSLEATREVVDLSKTLAQMSCFKVCPPESNNYQFPMDPFRYIPLHHFLFTFVQNS